MNLGDKVTYIRRFANEEGKLIFSEGTGVVTGIGLDGSKNAIVLLKDGDKKFNAYVSCLNRDKAFHALFKTKMTEIEAIAAEGKKKQQEVIDDYNARTSVIYDEIVGKPIEL